MLQSVGSQRVRHDLVTEQQQTPNFIMRLLGHSILRGKEEGRDLFKRLQNILDSIMKASFVYITGFQLHQ